jgi:REP-associated tyrosine transposase
MNKDLDQLSTVLVGETRERLWAFMGGIARRNGVKPICIGGVEDHVYLLLSMPTTLLWD